MSKFDGDSNPASTLHLPQPLPDWFAFPSHQRDFLAAAPAAYVAFGCGSPEAVLLIPFTEFREWLEGIGTTEREDRFYWHVVIYREGDRFVLHRRKEEERIDLSRYLLVGREEAAML